MMISSPPITMHQAGTCHHNAVAQPPCDSPCCHRHTRPQVQRVMVIDTDAHQGNGVARDKLHFKDGDLFILDVYNCR